MRLAKLALVAFVLTGCSAGPDGERAQELLQQAQAANATVRSSTYVATLAFSGAGQRFKLSMDGGAVAKGKAAGDQFLRMRAEGLPAAAALGAADLMLMVKRGKQITLSIAGETQTLEAPDTLTRDTHAWGALASFELASCVERVDVEKGRNLNGEPATRIAGTVNTVCLLKSLAKFSGLGSLAGRADLNQLRSSVGDIRATLFVSERSHLLIGGLVSITAESQGQKFDVQFSYRLTSVNEPVRFPG